MSGQDSLTAALDGIRERDIKLWDRRGKVGLYTQSLIEAAHDDVPRLLAAVDAVLAFCADRDRMAAGLASGAGERMHPALAPFNARARHDREIAAALRNAISRALLAENSTDARTT